MSRLDRIEDLPGLKRVAPQRSTQRTVLASLAAAAWPPLIITLIKWPPENWASGVDTDWRLVLLVLGLIAALGAWRTARDFDWSPLARAVVAVLAAIPLLGMGVCLGLLFKALRERG